MKSKKPKNTTKKPARRTPASAQTSFVSEDLHAHIVKRAYEIYQRRIRQGALDDWLQAEREILEQEWNPEMPHRGGYAGEEQE
jgi:hypothetical protein